MNPLPSRIGKYTNLLSLEVSKKRKEVAFAVVTVRDVISDFVLTFLVCFCMKFYFSIAKNLPDTKLF